MGPAPRDRGTPSGDDERTGAPAGAEGPTHVRAAEALRALVDQGSIAQLATLDASGHPAVSLVPYVHAWGPLRLFALVSELAPHTRALREDPRCGLLVHAAPVELAHDAREHHAIERLSIRANARFLSRDEARDASVEERYRAKFRAMAGTLLGLRDFAFVAFEPLGASFIQGFGRAYAARGDDLEVLEHVTGR